MKVFLQILVGAVLYVGTACASKASNSTSSYMDSYIGTETAMRLQQEFNFLEETIAKLLSEGACGTISYMWNPSHTTVLFFSVSPPSGTYHCRFWAYQKTTQGEWMKLGEYDFSTRYGANLDLERLSINVQSNGFQLSFSDGDAEVSHFFSFVKKEESFYYKMVK